MRKEKILALGVAAVLAVSMMSGCSIKSDTPIIGKIAGLDSNQVFKVGDLICTKPEYMLVLMDEANKYKSNFGSGVDWKSSIDEKTTLEEYILNKAKEDISVRYTLASMAKNNGVTITNEESKAIENAAKLYYQNITDAEANYTSASEDDVISLYTNYMLAEKVYNKITEGIEEKVSDEAARVIKIQYIRMSKLKMQESKIKSTLKKVTDLVNGGYQTFAREAKENSQDDLVELVLKKNEATRPFEIAAFELKSKEISNIINDGNDYYLVYCVDSYMKSESATNKAQLIKSKKDSEFNSKYKKYLKNVKTDFNSRTIENIKIPNEDKIASYNLISVFNNIEVEE